MFMVSTKKIFSFVAALAMLVSIGTAAASFNPVIGAPADLEQVTMFQSDQQTAQPWQMTVYSYAYYGGKSSTPPAATLPNPSANQTLFVYLLHMTENAAAFPAAVNEFAVANAGSTIINAVGFSTNITPEGFAGLSRAATSSFASLESQSIHFGFGGENSLLPGEDSDYALVYFLATAVPGMVNSAAIGGSATSAKRQLLGPVGPLPEPASAMLLLIGATLVARRRAN